MEPSGPAQACNRIVLSLTFNLRLLKNVKTEPYKDVNNFAIIMYGYET